MNSLVAALFFSISVILTICILHVFGSPRAAQAWIIFQSAEFRYDFKSSQVFRLRRKKEKEMYFKNLEKKRNIFSAHYKLHLRTTHAPSFFFLFFRSQIHAPSTRTLRHTRYSVLFLKTTSGICRYLLVTTFRYFIRTIYKSI